MMAFVVFGAAGASAQDANGPLAPPPEHDVHRVTTTQPMEAPPALAPAEIIKEFAAKEEKFLRARVQYGYKKSIKLTEFGRDGQPAGEYQLTVQMVLDSDGRPYEKIVDQKQSTLRALVLTPDNVKIIGHLPAYPLIPQQLAKYDLRYVGAEKVDEIDCYIIDAKPKLLERAQAWRPWRAYAAMHLWNIAGDCGVRARRLVPPNKVPVEGTTSDQRVPNASTAPRSALAST